VQDDLHVTLPHEPVVVWRKGAGPFDGLRVGRVLVYEFEVPEEYLRPGADACQRVFVLLDENIQLNQPVVFSPDQHGWWYVDLVHIEEADDQIATGLGEIPMSGRNAR